MQLNNLFIYTVDSFTLKGNFIKFEILLSSLLLNIQCYYPCLNFGRLYTKIIFLTLLQYADDEVYKGLSVFIFYNLKFRSTPY